MHLPKIGFLGNIIFQKLHKGASAWETMEIEIQSIVPLGIKSLLMHSKEFAVCFLYNVFICHIIQLILSELVFLF